MQSFISETIDDILKTTQNFRDIVFIVPSQRSKVFLKKNLKEKITIGFLPEMLSIEQFITEISGIKKAENLELLFQFYTVYKSLEKNPDTFDIFTSWAFTVLQDFNEIDQYLINTKDIFVYLRDIQRLKKWSVKGIFKETDLMKDHYQFLEKLNTYYPVLYKLLLKKKLGYQGLIYREACSKIEKFTAKHIHKKFFFLGFNALNKAEEFLFQKMLANGNSEIYWDIDNVFFNSNHQAGNFIRKYKKTWKYYEKNKIKTIGNTFSKPKNIQVIGAAKNVTQVKYAGELLATLKDFNNTALVLADETLLPITLNSLPKNVDAINITMGYPLKDIPTTNLLFSIFQLFTSQEKLQKQNTNEFYYKDVIRFLQNPTICAVLSTENSAIITNLSEEIAKENITFIDKNKLVALFKKTPETVQKIISSIFNSFISIDEFINRILNFINLIKENVTPLEKEYLYRYYTAFTQLKALQNEYNYFTDVKNLSLFFKQLIVSETLSFQGEPLQGLQLMGMLETRVLDFESIILIATNEGILPANAQQNSFIPFDVKINFGLPTYREKDAIFSYHFFRLLQRATNIYILYNTENDVFGSGEKSRFVTQLEMMRNDISHTIISPKINTHKIPLLEIEKDAAILKKLKELADKGISPSTLTNYLYNPIAFYKHKILKIKEFEEVEETVGFNTLGTVVHETLDELYTPFINKFLSVTAIVEMEKKANFLVQKYFTTHFKNGDITTGKNRLIFEVAKRFINNFLAQEKQLLQNNQLKILATEETLATEIKIDGIEFPIKIHGQVDRVDQLNGVLRIIDYKTGMVNTSNLRISNFDTLRDEKHHKAIQVLLYSFLYTSNNKEALNKPIEAGIISFKNLKKGFLPINFSSNYRQPNLEITQEKLDDFLVELKKYIEEIYNPEISFLEPADLRY